MNLQDIAFMIDLIKASYRRRMLYFLVNIASLIAPFVIMFSIPSLGDTGWVAVLLVVMVVAVIRGVLVYGLADDQYNFPWLIKDRQLKALQENISGGGEFSQLKNSPSLQEYFAPC